MALITLLRRWTGQRGRRTAMMLAALGLFGASLFFGDSMITPAISVLSAVEGLKVIEPDFEDFVVPITAVIIVALFSVQRHGTAAVGRFFGPVMIVWFVAIGACGVMGIVDNPEILKALSPTYALTFMVGPLPHRVLLPRRDRAVRHRRRGAVRRHGPLRPQGHHVRLARPRAARLHAELLRSGCAGARRRVQGERAVLPAHPGVGADSDGAAGDRGDGHRVAGGDHRGVLGGVAGGSARLPAAAAHRAHLGVDDRPDLRAVDQRGADGGGADPGLRVPQLGRAGVRVRHGGDGHDHHHHHAVLLLRPHPVGLAAVAGADRRRLPAAGRPDVPRGEPDQAGARRLAAAAHRRSSRSR